MAVVEENAFLSTKGDYNVEQTTWALKATQSQDV